MRAENSPIRLVRASVVAAVANEAVVVAAEVQRFYSRDGQSCIERSERYGVYVVCAAFFTFTSRLLKMVCHLSRQWQRATRRPKHRSAQQGTQPLVQWPMGAMRLDDSDTFSKSRGIGVGVENFPQNWLKN
jgi:hypothetical protein